MRTRKNDRAFEFGAPHGHPRADWTLPHDAGENGCEVLIATHSMTAAHIEIHYTRDFDSVAKSLENKVPLLDPAILNDLASGDLQIAEERIGKTSLFIFLKRDHAPFCASPASTERHSSTRLEIYSLRQK